ncbi:neutral/alkaline non-lysosomal ceramidase N-terminal domain-containing protein [Marinobacter sp. MDS2]|uniref:neutral/alkaline non-lysosomal ceramidase N-terminal domain-containing protein n=1 Tax=Marinobacter sp. MDS2 TaxID=3065961 RepID=UPI00273B2D20|nr:neutral/alkaline non-lysosomal ceramidase N-terminal domain-containing protein [Marinobacter sp. MDS2]MDP4549225.1 neutral/alkaline non-lysosomal ceramidase N-terminal domain-containing protein [Marinobacter sp. MDS2]
MKNNKVGLVSRHFGLAFASALLLACGGDQGSSDVVSQSPAPNEPGPSVDVEPNVAAFANPELAQCVMESPLREVGKGMDAPSMAKPAAKRVQAVAQEGVGSCAANREFRFGSGLSDITGPVALKSGAGWEDSGQVMHGLHQRQYARAFAIESPCNDKRVMFVSADIGLMWGSVRNGVLAALAKDPELAAEYTADNLMLSATHTHNGPAGYAHHEAGNALHLGFDSLVYKTNVNGIVDAIARAHRNIEANEHTAPIEMAVGELLNTNINRSRPAYAMNPEQERRQYLNIRGEEVDVAKTMVQLNLRRKSGSPVGVINWFGVHPTVMGPEVPYVSSDVKGFASLGFEQIMATEYRAEPGKDSFVAAFAQADEGDASPNIFINKFPHPDPRRGGGEAPMDSNAISGTKQLARALELWQDGQPLSGGVDYRLMHVQMNKVTVTDPNVLSRLEHPPELDTPEKQTCNAALGVSFPAGAEDGPGPISQEGLTCSASPDLLRSAAADFAGLTEMAMPLKLVSDLLLCNVQHLTVLGLGCHAEKPILLPTNLGEIAGGLPNKVTGLLGLTSNFEPAIHPLQIFQLGNLALVGLPWEVTTMSARRLRDMIQEELAPVGVDTVVIAGLVNGYIHYLTTREEYASQQYEGASNAFGPWSLAAVTQELRKLADSMVQGTVLPVGPELPKVKPVLRRLPYIPSDSPGEQAFGTVLEDVPAIAVQGDEISARFQASHPRNDLMLNDSYAYAERLNEDGNWQVVATDRSPNLLYTWHPRFLPAFTMELPYTGASEASVNWHLPRNLEPGTYRLRTKGVAQPGGAWEGVSGVVEVVGSPAICP